MSFPGSFSSQLSSIMEALLKAVVAEVTALVEDGAVELRLELRDRDQQILEKERDIEERDRVIEELRAAVEELTAAREEQEAREEREAAAQSSAAEEGPEQSEGRDWSHDEEDSKSAVKCEPSEGLTAASPKPQASLWPPPLSAPAAAADAAAACSFDSQHETPSYSQYSQATDNLSNINQANLSLDSFLNRNQEQFYSTQPGFPLIPDPGPAPDSVRLKNMKRKLTGAKGWNCGKYRCNQCGKTFTAKCRLITHQSVHTGARPYTCDRCGRGFSRTDSLTRHKKKDACGKELIL